MFNTSSKLLKEALEDLNKVISAKEPKIDLSTLKLEQTPQNSPKLNNTTCANVPYSNNPQNIPLPPPPPPPNASDKQAPSKAPYPTGKLSSDEFKEELRLSAQKMQEVLEQSEQESSQEAAKGTSKRRAQGTSQKGARGASQRGSKNGSKEQNGKSEKKGILGLGRFGL